MPSAKANWRLKTPALSARTTMCATPSSRALAELMRAHGDNLTEAIIPSSQKAGRGQCGADEMDRL
jgi:hypothetical protein